ncbi:hypothetical protein CCMA1212_009552 [Trichoderma ghanense]|uniref:Uncharacterized protein n=1 Tax=Trichoderma ghanense TaxID=65468 RepID=A0ABY2GS19_9HYPO
MSERPAGRRFVTTESRWSTEGGNWRWGEEKRRGRRRTWRSDWTSEAQSGLARPEDIEALVASAGQLQVQCTGTDTGTGAGTVQLQMQGRLAGAGAVQVPQQLVERLGINLCPVMAPSPTAKQQAMAGKPSRFPAGKIPLPLAVANETAQGRGSECTSRGQARSQVRDAGAGAGCWSCCCCSSSVSIHPSIHAAAGHASAGPPREMLGSQAWQVSGTSSHCWACIALPDAIAVAQVPIQDASLPSSINGRPKQPLAASGRPLPAAQLVERGKQTSGELAPSRGLTQVPQASPIRAARTVWAAVASAVCSQEDLSFGTVFCPPAPDASPGKP